MPVMTHCLDVRGFLLEYHAQRHFDLAHREAIEALALFQIQLLGMRWWNP